MNSPRFTKHSRQLQGCCGDLWCNFLAGGGVEQELSFSNLRNVSNREIVLGYKAAPLPCERQWQENNSSPFSSSEVLEKEAQAQWENLYLVSFYYFARNIHMLLCVVITFAPFHKEINHTVCSTGFKFAKNKHSFTAFQNTLLFGIFQDFVFTKYLTVYSLIITESLKQFGLIYCLFCFMDEEPKGKWCSKLHTRTKVRTHKSQLQVYSIDSGFLPAFQPWVFP